MEIPMRGEPNCLRFSVLVHFACYVIQMVIMVLLDKRMK